MTCMQVINLDSSKDIIKAYILTRPKNGRGEITRLGQYLKVSTTLISQVLAGQKTLTIEQAFLFVSYAGLGNLEADYFLFLIQLERAGNEELKQYWKKKITEIKLQGLKLANRVNVSKQLTDTEKAIFYSNGLYSAMRLYASVGGKGKSLEEIAERFSVSRAKCSEMLNFLVGSGLCLKENEKYFMGSQKTHLEEGSPFLVRHHANWRMRSIRQSEDLTKEELMYTAPVSLSREDFQNLREQMVGFIQTFLKQVHASKEEEVACLNLDFFWVRN